MRFRKSGGEFWLMWKRIFLVLPRNKAGRMYTSITEDYFERKGQLVVEKGKDG